MTDIEPEGYDAYRPYVQRLMKGERNVLTSEAVLLLEPTGGSTAGPKLIPYTSSLKKEYQRSIQPWVVSLFLKWPGLFLGRQYWCVTPSTEDPIESEIPVGFDSDASYLGLFQQAMTKRMFAVPPEIAQQNDPQEVRVQTLLHLLQTPDLRLISVWHPSFLTLLLDLLQDQYEELLLQLPVHRAEDLRRIGCRPDKIWKKLKVISCWAGPTCSHWVNRIQQMFPHAVIQPKGLLATEGVTSIPIGLTSDVAAVRSHVLEFVCEQTDQIFPLWDLEVGNTYEVLLTTGGGLYRYRTFDRVLVTGTYRRTPCLQFLTRTDLTTDLVGEKVSLPLVQTIIEALPSEVQFAMVAPEQDGDVFRYTLFVEGAHDPESLAAILESGLCQNYQYRHARHLGQLSHSSVCEVKNGSMRVRQTLVGMGKQDGAMKLLPLRSELNWRDVLSDPS